MGIDEREVEHLIRDTREYQDTKWFHIIESLFGFYPTSTSEALDLGIAKMLKLKKEIENLKRWVEDCQSGMYINCVYCGHRYGPNDEVGASMQQVLYDHIAECPKHPMSAMKRRIETLESNGGLELEGARETAREFLSDYAHKAWSGWMKYMWRCCDRNEDGSNTIPPDLVDRWSRQMATSYKDLPEEEKESDRDEADKILAIIDRVALSQRKVVSESESSSPVAEEIESLKALKSQVQKCDNGHQYLADSHEYPCPWCLLAKYEDKK